MNTKFSRFILALALALSVLGASASTALADKPAKFNYSYTMPGVLEGVCSFPVDILGSVNATETDFFDTNGLLTQALIHMDEQDAFSANGKTLAGLPFTFELRVLFDNSGNTTHVYADGVAEKVLLPDGSLFISAGRLDFAAHPGADFIITPDEGTSGNIAGFCAALAP